MAFETDTDPDLLGYMAMQEDDPEGARAAWGVFFVRHRQAVFHHVLGSYGDQLGGDAGAGDLCAEVFRRAFLKAHTFKARSNEPEVVSGQVVAWLCRIAKTIFLDLLRRRARLPVIALVDEIAEADTDVGEEDPIENEQVKQARDVFAGLSGRERVVLLETMQWFNHETGKSQMPRGVARELADRLGTTPPNIRQIRLRALAKFEERFGVVLQARANT